MRYYKDLLGTDNVADNHVSNVIINEGKVVNVSQQRDLCASFTGADVKVASFDIDEEKVVGLDGYPSGFFRKGWSCVGNDIVTGVLDFF